MKLADIRGERVFIVLAELVEPVANIAADDEAVKLFKRQKCPKGKTPRQFMIERIRASVPPLMREHRKDLVSIIAILKDVSTDEYLENVTMASLVMDVLDMLNDEDLLAFFS